MPYLGSNELTPGAVGGGGGGIPGVPVPYTLVRLPVQDTRGAPSPGLGGTPPPPATAPYPLPAPLAPDPFYLQRPPGDL